MFHTFHYHSIGCRTSFFGVVNLSLKRSAIAGASAFRYGQSNFIYSFQCSRFAVYTLR